MQFARQVLLDPLELRRRHDVGDVEFARAVLSQFGAGIGDVHEVHFIELRRGVVPVVRVPAQDDVRTDDPVRQHEGAVRHELARTRVLRAVRSQRGPCTGNVPGWDSSPSRYGAGVARRISTVRSSGALTPSSSGCFSPRVIALAFTTGSMNCAYGDAVFGSTSRRMPAT